MRASLVLAAAIAACALAVSADSAPRPAAKGAAALHGVNFVSACRFSHRLMDDPIVFPGRRGASHDHTFVGNRTTSADSTLASLLAGATTCRRAEDTAAYWVPTLLVDGRPIEPRGATVYYRRRTLDPVHAFPAGLRMIAGDAHATAPQDRRVTFWSCGHVGGVQPSAAVPTCPGDRRTGLRLHVRFPNCWDGRNLDSVDHKSHMAYSRRGACPATHPVAVPALAVIFRYPTTGGAGISLASGGQYSGHADFFNAWNQQTLEALVDGCLNALRHCGRGV